MASATVVTCCGHPIPVEIITLIFKHAAPYPISADPTRLAIGLVAKSWHRALYQTPSLWNDVILLLSEDKDGNEWYPTISSWSFLRQALELSHPLPFDIYIISDRRQHYPDERNLANFFTVIRSHLSRWRSFKIRGQGSMLADFLKHPGTEIIATKTLHTLSILLTDASDCDLNTIRLTPSLRHLAINFPTGLDGLNPHCRWSGLASLRAGFNDMAECRSILTQATSLTELRVNHIGAAGTQVTPFKHAGIKELQINFCALLAMHSTIRLPNLTHLILTDQKPTHTAHISLECPAVRHRADIYVEHAVHLLQTSDAHIHSLKINSHIRHTESLLKLLRLVQRDLTTLRIGGGSTLHPILTLMEGHPPLLPKLQWLEIFENGADAQFQDNPMVEQFILSRWRPAPEQNVASLETFILRRLDEVKSTTSLSTRNVCAGSSLAQTLLKCSSEGLDVEWTYVGDDVLALARKRRVTRF